jgi:hypothetical protein
MMPSFLHFCNSTEVTNIMRGWYSNWLQAGCSGDWIPVGARFCAHVQTGPVAHAAFCTMGTRSFPGVKRPGHGADYPPLSGLSNLLRGTLPFTNIMPVKKQILQNHTQWHLDIHFSNSDTSASLSHFYIHFETSFKLVFQVSIKVHLMLM